MSSKRAKSSQSLSVAVSQFRTILRKMVQDAKKISQRACLKRLNHYPLYMQPPVNAQPRDVDNFSFRSSNGGK
ncbi:hypothetical protein CCUS01_15426 [Colletotrichum cuscutae]|uniref:Uncharacterized protein n=1 Tax=Colletotrichum cuscutae TaxID=1209917 RepID=A0AAI9Y7S1_9PEZI|nr:hypothetical protein CCUS01_15426 [Colletotrichum cuscutae]